MTLALAALGAACALGSVLGYLLYTLGGVAALRPWLGGPRRIALGLAFPLAVAALVLGLRESEPWAVRLAGLTFVAGLYALRRQWVWPRPAGPLARWDGEARSLPADTLAVELPGGAALPLGWLSYARTATWGRHTAIYCSLSRSLCVVRTPPAGPPRALLPHATGFEVGAGARRWDGVDGQALDGGDALERVPVRVVRLGDWLLAADGQSRGEGQRVLLGVPGQASQRSPRLVDVPLVPAARGVADGQRLGVVQGGAWRVWSPTVDATYTSFLSRWAAKARGLREADAEERSASTAPG